MANDEFGRPLWDDYFMALAFVASRRSFDPDTKHGCVIVSADNHILTMGFNGPPRGADDWKIPRTRPEKYPFMAHAESNAIDNSVERLEGGTAYVTGRPCSKCLLRLIQNGIRKIVYGPVKSSCVDNTDEEDSEKLLSYMKPSRRPEMVRYLGDNFCDVLYEANWFRNERDC
jgi:deoxycytidylate deaminase